MSKQKKAKNQPALSGQIDLQVAPYPPCFSPILASSFSYGAVATAAPLLPTKRAHRSVPFDAKW